MRSALSAIGLGIVLVASTARADIQVRASVDRTQVAVGERLLLTIEASGSQNVPAPNLGDVSGFQAQYLGPSTQVSFVNGQVSATITHRYALVAQRAGQATLGPFQVEHEGKRYAAAAINVQVTAQTQAQAPAAATSDAAATDIRLEVIGVKPDAFIGERIPIVLKLLVGNVRVDQLQYPKLPGQGFVLDAWAEPQQTDEVIQGRRYRSVRFSSVLTPLHPGPLVLAPAMDMQVLTSRRRGRGFGDPVFDDFFGGAFAERNAYQARAEMVTIDVKPLPEQGRPVDYSGAVGEFDFTVDVRPVELNAGDPVTVRMEIKGAGNLDSVAAPALAAGDQFRSYDPAPVKDAEKPGVRAYEQVVIPKKAGALSLPELRFSFFDPRSGSYRTIRRGPFPLVVREAAAAPAPQVLGPATSERQQPAEQLGRDIVYIKDAAGSLRPRAAPSYRRAWFLVLQVLPLAAFVALAAYGRRRDRLAADPRLVRFRRASSEARQVLAALTDQSLDGARFHDELAAGVRAYLGAKLDLPPGAVEREQVLQRLTTNGTGEGVRAQIESLFGLIERARYAASAATPAERETALRLAREIVAQLDRSVSPSLPRRGSGGGRAAIALLALCSGATFAAAQDAGNDPHTSFFEGNAAYKAARYADAAGAYEAVVSAGVEGGALYFNLGNAYFKGGELGKAVLNYERALRLLPRDPDVRANLTYARELAHDDTDDAPLWRRLLLPFERRATTGELAGAAGAFWWVTWGLLIVRQLRPSQAPVLIRAAAAAALLLVVVGANLVARLVQVDLSRAAVVTSDGETAVRFEPSATGTQYFTVTEGTSVTVTDTRDGWLQIRRRDGRRGWVSVEAVSEL